MTVGITLGSYELGRELGKGEMGVVYAGRHQRLGRAAAIKVLYARYSKDRDAVTRFFNEARAATALRHPSIVEIYDVGFAPDGSAYVAMELCDGESLTTRLRRQRALPLSMALAIARQIASALAAAHKAGIIHRDLKPDNVFLVPDPDIAAGERIKLLDFGIARLATKMGMPFYMSPEQCRGTGKVDHRTDLYSLGCMLFEIVCGRVPFLGAGPGEIISGHLMLPPPPARVLAPNMSLELEQLVLALLAKQPAHRPETAEHVVTELHRLAGAVAPTTLPL